MRQCLVIDDSRVIRTIASSIFKSLECSVCEAETGIEGLDFCRVHMPDVILLDMQMPSMSSVEFLRSLRRSPGGQHPYVILATVENDVLRLTEVLSAGADEYVMKPFDRAALEAKLVRTTRAANSASALA